MADRGDIGQILGGFRSHAEAFAGRAIALASGGGAAAGAVVCVILRGAVVATVAADGAGDWTTALNDGTYWAAEVGTLRAWLIEVAGATVTVTPQTGGGGGDTIIAGSAWAYIG